MNLTFKTITVRNFQSYGNDPVTVDLQKHKSTVIVADNGAGKTALIFDSIFYALYGQTMKDIKKNQVVNYINKKACEITLELQVDNDAITIKRGQSPDLFEVELNDEIVWDDLGVLEKQKLLNDKLRLTRSVMEQLLFIGADNISFMKRTPANRREFIERILDLEIFSKMNENAKGKVKKLKSDISTLGVKITENEYHLESYNSLTQDVEVYDHEELEKAEAFLDKANKKLSELEAQIEDNRTASANIIDLRSKENFNKSDLEKRLERENKINKSLSKGKCPVCKQSVSNYEELVTGVEQYKAQIDKSDKSISKLSDDLDELKVEANTLSDKKKDLESYVDKANNTVKWQQELGKKQNASSNVEKKIEQTQLVLAELEEEKEELQNELDQYDAIANVLKSGTAKNTIVSEYIPFICERVNFYLDKMNFPVHFDFDESFNESFRARYIDKSSYRNFSTGQQARIDFALLLTWRDVAAKISTVKTNLFVVDEFGSNLDKLGQQMCLDLIDLQEDINFFAMTPNPSLTIGFDSVLRIEHSQNFSKLI